MYMYAALGVASVGIGDNFYQECATFEDKIVSINMPVLMYEAKIAGAPFREVKGPDVLDFEIFVNEHQIEVLVSARVSDS